MRSRPPRPARWARWLAGICALLLPALACNLPSQAEPTLALFPNTRTPISTNTFGPTATWLQPGATQPHLTPTTGPTSTYDPGFQATFDQPLENWLDWFTLTTRAPGGQLSSSFSQRNGRLSIELADAETYLYRYYKLPQPADSYVEARFLIDGQKENQLALVCRAAEDHSAWYEARISGTGGYQLYRYSLARKTRDGLNPFLNLGSGSADRDAFQPGEINLVRFTCQGNTLSLTFGGGKQRIQVEDEALRAEGLLGFGVVGYDNFPTSIQIGEIDAGRP
jgi:hypothetical protein